MLNRGDNYSGRVARVGVSNAGKWKTCQNPSLPTTSQVWSPGGLVGPHTPFRRQISTDRRGRQGTRPHQRYFRFSGFPVSIFHARREGFSPSAKASRVKSVCSFLLELDWNTSHLTPPSPTHHHHSFNLATSTTSFFFPFSRLFFLTPPPQPRVVDH
jgi:hypothetical protein